MTKREHFNAGGSWPPPSNYTCRAIGKCLAPIPDGHLLCNKHWLLAPKRMRRRLWRVLRTPELIDFMDWAGRAWGLIQLVVAEREIQQLNANCKALSSRAWAAESKVSSLETAMRHGEHGQAAYLAAGMAVQEMLRRQS